MTYNSDAGDLEAGVPARFLRGSVFEDYVVVGDPTTGQVVTLPAGGAAAPWRSWIVADPVTVARGTHSFGHFRKPQAIVARAPVGSGPGQVGIRHGTRGDLSYGPASFDVAPDGTVWVVDTVNSRLLACAPGHPGCPVRTVGTPRWPLELTITPNGRSQHCHTLRGAEHRQHLRRPQRLLRHHGAGWPTLTCGLVKSSRHAPARSTRCIWASYSNPLVASDTFATSTPVWRPLPVRRPCMSSRSRLQALRCGGRQPGRSEAAAN